MKHNGKLSLAEFRAIIAIAIVLVLVISFPSIKDLVFPTSQNSEPLALHSHSLNASAQTETQRPYPEDKSRFKPRHYQNKANSVYDKKRKSTAGYKQVTDLTTRVNCNPFDPNTVSLEELVSMGVSSYVSNNLIKFRHTGARFRKPADVKRIYGVDSTLFLALERCITIPAEPGYTASSDAITSKPIDINTAGIEEWKSLPGIGEVLASRIIKYRDHLGGFHSISQIGETYGLPLETLELIKDKVVMSSGPRSLDINSATLETLAAHPYITQKQAETIVNFRSHHGSFTELKDILKIYSLQPEWLERMQPYLACDVAAEAVADLVVR